MRNYTVTITQQTTITIFFLNLEHNKLSDHENIILSGHITEGECLDAIRNMKHNKSPGSDGLSVEFYKTFWTDIKSFYTKSINYSYGNGSLTELQNQSVITLIPKIKIKRYTFNYKLETENVKKG